ncbi:SRPBCC family protein [Methyloprofundus sp.]|uniref:SRPBCC family protein n=1 Tax=Methyloprofundus sp. TaxID=2020875 RepID=UPI003D104165
MKKISLLALFLFLFSAISYAHGPVRGKMTATVEIDAPAAEVWDVIKNFDDMSWHPGIKSTDATGGNEKGATRVLTFVDGYQVTEEMKKYDEKKMSYKYKMIKIGIVKTIQHSGKDEDVPIIPVDNYQAVISVTKKGNSSVVKWVATYYRGYMNNNPPVELNEDAADKKVTEVLEAGLTSLLHKFEPNTLPTAITFTMRR